MPVPSVPSPRPAEPALDSAGQRSQVAGPPPRADGEPIAIVGIGLRFPGGNDTLDGFEEFLREGRSGFRPVPEDRWDGAAFTSGDRQARGKIRTAGGGFLDRIDQFDAQFFNISPLEAQNTDPQQRILLETAWEALENANINPATLRHGNGGVYIGASSIDYALELDSVRYEDLDGHLAAGITTFPMSGRLSYFLGWRGPSLSTDTACASSLTALHLAAEGLRNRECDIALCGAVNAIHHPRILVMFSHGQMLASDGRCKTFDEAADGYARAEGCGVLVVKRLADAVRDGDTVLAVVRGTAIGQDGASAGLTVPNGTAQEMVMRAALANARLQPHDIQYVEAHGTGTALGDPIEMGAISDVFKASHTRADPVVVGSLKTNLGHMEPVAGIGSIVKAVLQLRAGTIFPHINLKNPSGRIPWDTIPVTVPTECVPWTAARRRALVNSFGFAGGIACAVVEEAPPAAQPAQPQATGGGAHVFTVSAKSKRSLRQQIERYQQYLAGHPDVPAGDVCYTANVGRSHFPIRIAGVAADRDALAALLERRSAELDKDGGTTGDLRKVAFLFTGQGSQYPGMGAPLYRQFPVFREHVDECDLLFSQHLGRSIKALVLGDAQDADAIHRTEFTQPALFTLEYALAKLWMSWGVRPSAMIGHSIGEVVAAAVAGLFTLADAAALVAARARLMQSVSAPGGMAAVACGVDEVAGLLGEYPDLAIAAINSPHQCVVSGGSGSLAKVAAILRERGLPVKPLAVSHAFHSPLMAEVFGEFGKTLENIRFREPALTVVSNLTGKVAKPAELSAPGYWIRHIAEPVNFEAGMRTIDRRGKHAFVEIGPSRSLIVLAQQCTASTEHRWLRSLDPADPDGTAIREAVAQMYSAGLPISWTGFHAGRGGRKVPLPPYAFDRKRYWLPRRGARHGLGGPAAGGQADHPLLGREVSTASQRESGEREFATRISASEPEYLGDHLVMGRVVFPGTGFLEIMLALQDAVYGDTRRPVRDVSVKEPLFLAEDRPAEVRTRLRPAGDGATVEIVSRVTEDGGVIERCHITAALGRRPEHADALSDIGESLRAQAAAVAEPDETLSPDEVYAAYAGAGLRYGPWFRRMGEVARYGPDFAIGTVRGHHVSAVEQLPPTIVDAAGHALAAVGSDGSSYLPIRYGSFRMFKKPKADDLRVLLRMSRPEAADVDVAIDFAAFDGDQPVFELCGLGMKRVADGSGAGKRSFVHELRWLKRSLAGQPSGEAHHVLVARCGDTASARLAKQAAGTGVTLSFARTHADVAAILRSEPVTDVCWFWQAPPADARRDAAALRDECERNHRDLLDLLGVLGREGFGRDQRLWLVTQRGQWLPGDEAAADPPPASAALWGFGHSLLNECPAYRVTMVDLPGDATGYGPLLDEWRARGSSEFQVAYRSGHRHVRRLLPFDPAAGQDTAANEALTVTTFGQFSGIKLVPADDVAPRDDEVQVQVRAAGVNFKDVLNALGMLKDFGDQPLGFEAAGTVIAAGPAAQYRPGDEVIVNYLGCMRRRVTVPSAVTVRKPANIGWTDAAGLAAVYVTAHYALHGLAKMRAGDKVLIHAAAGGVGQAAVQLAKAAGAQVYATASPHKWPLLRAQGVEHVMNSRSLDFADEIMRLTGGKGVDIVLNSLNKDYIPAGMRSLAEGGRFVEMGKVGAWTPEQVREARPDVEYHNFDLSDMPLDRAIRITSEIMRTVAECVERGELPPIKTTVYSLEEVDEAFGVLSRGANIGKLVLSFEGHAAAPVRDVTIEPGLTYVITGGLGALGLLTADKLADLGARHIALVSRRGTPASDVARLMARLREKAEVTIYQGDVAEPADVGRIVAALGRSGHPVGGVVHAAGTLADAPYSAQTWETIDAVYRPKVYGTWLLHEAARSFPELQFFVCYSSAAPVSGTPGQTNYAGANAFMDNLCLWRAGHGLPGMTVNWSPVGEVGMSARLNEQVLRRWRAEGIKLTPPAAGMRALTELLGGRLAQAVVGECDWERFVPSRPVASALYQRLMTTERHDAGAGLDLETLIAGGEAERTSAITQFVRGKVADVLHFDDADGVDPSTEFVRLGLDSLVAVELKNALEAVFRLPLPSSVVFDYPSAERLGEFLSQQLVPASAR